MPSKLNGLPELSLEQPIPMPRPAVANGTVPRPTRPKPHSAGPLQVLYTERTSDAY